MNLKRFTLLLLGFICSVNALQAQMPYSEFKRLYTPHNQPGISTKTEGVVNANKMSASELAPFMETFVMGDEKEVFMGLITSMRRELAGGTIDNMEPSRAIRGLNWLKDEWVLEVVWYVNENTYNKIAAYLTAITGYTGITPGQAYAPVKKFHPIYAYAGYQLGFGGYRGINKWVEAYNSNTVKTDGSVVTTPMNKMHGNKGFGLGTALYLSHKKALDIHFSNRSALAHAVLNNGAFDRYVKYSGKYLSLGLLNYERLGKFDLYSGFGIDATFGGLNIRLDQNGNKADYKKIDNFFNVGLSYKVYLQRQLSPKIPLMLTINPWFHLNLLKNDFTELNTQIPNLFAQEEIDKMKSGASSIGIELGLAWNFRGKKAEPVKVYPIEMDPLVNTVFEELNPIVSPDGRTLYFSRNTDPRNTNGINESQDIWMADISVGLDSARAKHMSKPFNQRVYNYMAGISPDENTILISGAFKNGEMIGKGYSLTHRTRNGWSDPEMVQIDGFTDMCKGNYAGAFLSNDGKHLVQYFSEVSGEETYDLFVSHLKEDGTWTRPVKLGNINTSSNEMSPFLASDGVTLYFASNRDGGYGSADIYVTKRLDDTWQNWSEPKNLGSEINSDVWDAYYTIDAQGAYAYMVSYKNKGKSSDIIRIKLKEDVRPEPVVLVKGRVLNAKTREPLEANVNYADLTNASHSGIARTNPATGEYKIVLPYGAEYSFLGEAANFVAQSNNLDLRKKGEYLEIERDILLWPIEVGSTVRLNNIFFETGKATLDNKSQNELDRLVKILKDNPTMEIEISGHTDNVGAADLNKKLSNDRAMAVVNYLVSKGIEKSRLVGKGYGMDKPVADNATEDGKQMNRRVEFTITKK